MSASQGLGTAGSALGAAGSIASSIPVFGQIAGGILSGIGSLFTMGAQKKAEREEKERLEREKLQAMKPVLDPLSGQATQRQQAAPQQATPAPLAPVQTQTPMFQPAGVVPKEDPAKDDLLNFITGQNYG